MVAEDQCTLALDAHGGDHGVAVTVPAALDALAADPALHIIVVGIEREIAQALKRNGADGDSRLRILPATEVVAPDARLSALLRESEGTSLWQAVNEVAAGRAQACVSGASTAALMALGLKLIGRLPGIHRPALMAHMPHSRGATAVLDLGANVEVNARHLVQFAVMGSVTAELADGIESPRIGLLNVGHEESKGHQGVREAHAVLGKLPLNYVGFIEGNDLFTGIVDVAVCDGFTGNLMLKSNEGLARMLVDEFRRSLKSSWAGRAGAWIAGRSIRRALARLNPSAHNGAPLLGLQGVVVKSHGGSDREGFTHAILEAGREARRRVPERIQASITEFHVERES